MAIAREAEPVGSLREVKEAGLDREDLLGVYRQMLGIEDEPHRYDVVTVVLGNDSTPQIELLRNFWTEASLRKRRWHLSFYD